MKSENESWGVVIIRVFTLVLVLASIFGSQGVIAGIVAMTMVDIPTATPMGNWYWDIFIAGVTILMSVATYGACKIMLQGRGTAFKEIVIALVIITASAVVVITKEALVPSLKEETAASQLKGAFIFMLFSLGIFASFRWALNNRDSDSSSQEHRR